MKMLAIATADGEAAEQPISVRPQHLHLQARHLCAVCKARLCLASQAERQLKNLFQFDHIVFTSKQGIFAVFQKLTELHGSDEAALKDLLDSKTYCWALGSDADVLRQLGVKNVQTPMEVCLPICYPLPQFCMS